jgi:hypothetical protein
MEEPRYPELVVSRGLAGLRMPGKWIAGLGSSAEGIDDREAMSEPDFLDPLEEAARDSDHAPVSKSDDPEELLVAAMGDLEDEIFRAWHSLATGDVSPAATRNGTCCSPHSPPGLRAEQKTIISRTKRGHRGSSGCEDDALFWTLPPRSVPRTDVSSMLRNYPK